MQAIINTYTAPIHVPLSSTTADGRPGPRTTVTLSPGVSFVEDAQWDAVRSNPVAKRWENEGRLVAATTVSSANTALADAPDCADRLVAQCFDVRLAKTWLQSERARKKPVMSRIDALEKRIAELTERGAA